MRAIFKIMFGFVAAFPVALRAEQSQICDDFLNLGWPSSIELAHYVLQSTVESRVREEVVQHFSNTDIDGDGFGDEISLGCSANTIPSDPCVMEAKLSSGEAIEFEAWHLFFVRYRGLVYAVTANEAGNENNIYRVGPKIMELICSIE
jgi:hypothetical protein